MKFIYEGDAISIDVIMELTGLTELQVIKKALNIGINKSGYIGREQYQITNPKAKRSRGKYQIEDVVLYDFKCNGVKRAYYYDDVKISKTDLMDKLGMSIPTFYKKTKQVKSMVINGIPLRTDIKSRELFTISKDGVEDKHMTKREIIALTGLSHNQVQNLANTGNYSYRGWRVTREFK